MSIEQQVRDAFEDLDELLLEGLAANEAITRAAQGNGLKPEILGARAIRQFGDLETHRANLTRAAEWRSQERNEQRAFAVREKQVREEAAHAAESTYYACCLDDPERAGRPSWSYCLERLAGRLKLSDGRLRQAAQETLYATLKRLDRKHGTRAAQLRD